MISGATESSFYYLAQHYKFPDNVDVKRTTQEIVESNKKFKIIWAHDNCDQGAHYNLPQHLDKVDVIVCVSKWEKEQYIKFNRAPAEKLVVIPNGVAEEFKSNGKKSKTAIFFSAPHKGVTALPKVWKQVIKNHPDAKLKVFSSYDLYGQDHVERNKIPEYIEAIEELKNLPGVEYSKCIDREELLPHIQDAAFFMHPNLWEETFCVSMVEAMACGCYPIVSDIGALREVSFNRGKYVPMLGENTPEGWKPSPKFINEFAQEVSRCFNFFDKEPETFYAATNDLSKITREVYSWKRISEYWKTMIEIIQCDDDWIYNEVYESNEYEIESFGDDDIVIDIGSHKGFFAKLCMDKGCKQIHCFEPEPENFNQLVENLKDYKYFQAYNLAVSDRSGKRILHRVLGHNTGLHSFYSEGPGIESNTVSLDDILDHIQKVSLLKIDAEGAEYEIIMNSKKLNKIKNIVGEYHDNYTDKKSKDLFEFLEKNNFTITKIKKSNQMSGLFFAKNNK
jgi:FkbM family methyltransferase